MGFISGLYLLIATRVDTHTHTHTHMLMKTYTYIYAHANTHTYIHTDVCTKAILKASSHLV